MAVPLELISGIADAYTNVEYTDLIINCKGETFEVHKVVVCKQSSFFRDAVKQGQLKEAFEDIIELPEENPKVVAAMLDYLYHANYRRPSDATSQEIQEHEAQQQKTNQESHAIPGKKKSQLDCKEKIPSAMHFHLHVWALADEFDIPGLKALAQQKFTTHMNEAWDSRHFPSAIELAYEITVAGAQGAGLRSVVVEFATKHLHALFNNGHGFSAMMDNTAEFGKDMAQAMAGGPLSATGSKNVKMSCPNCNHGFIPTRTWKPDRTVYCPSCGVGSRRSSWMPTADGIEDESTANLSTSTKKRKVKHSAG